MHKIFKKCNNLISGIYSNEKFLSGTKLNPSSNPNFLELNPYSKFLRIQSQSQNRDFEKSIPIRDRLSQSQNFAKSIQIPKIPFPWDQNAASVGPLLVY